MIVLRQTEEPQNLKFIPRQYNANKVVLTDESTNLSVEILASFSQEKYYLQSDIVFDLIEGRFYNITVFNDTDIVYKDKVFCTNQDVLNYSINKNRYTSNTTDNSYIIL